MQSQTGDAPGQRTRRDRGLRDLGPLDQCLRDQRQRCFGAAHGAKLRLGDRTHLWAIVLVCSTALAGCNGLDVLPEPLRPDSRHQQYAKNLEQAGLAASAMVRAWSSAADAAVQDPLSVSLPLREDLYFDPANPTAYGYRVELQPGQRLTARLELEVARAETGTTPETASGTGMAATAEGWFLDLFLWREATDGSSTAIRLGEAEIEPSGGVHLAHDVRQAGTYLVRLQSELLAGGRATLNLRADGVLAFPVAGGRERDIGSRFGDPRDGGARRHHGVDIFARRGTPVVAAASGRISRVGTNRLGGKVVWMRTDGGLGLYYAHLDSQTVDNGQRVAVGDEIGRVGNTGNARTTPPHLHFGVYRNGPRDPSPYLARSPKAAPPGLAPEALGTWRRTRGSGAVLRSGPGRRYQPVDRLERATAAWVEGQRAGWYRIRLADGRRGYLAASATEGTEHPLRRRELEAEAELTSRPDPRSIRVARIAGGEEVAVLARFGDAQLVRPSNGATGWLAR